MNGSRGFSSLLRRYLPILDWGARYTGKTFTNDLIVAGIVTVMLIPQSLAYAMLAGLPAQVGLYASIAPLVLYAIFGTSRALAVGPVAVASLMTAAAAATVATQGTPEYLGAAIALAAISGLLLLAMGLLRLGFLANFLSHPVISGFITASGIQIAAGQFAPVLGIHAEGENFVDLLKSMWPNLGHINPYTATIGLSEVKGPIMDGLKRSHLLEELTGRVHLTQFDAVASINPNLARRTLEAQRVPLAVT
jgi:sulfate permease, SulP family